MRASTWCRLQPCVTLSGNTTKHRPTGVTASSSIAPWAASCKSRWPTAVSGARSLLKGARLPYKGCATCCVSVLCAMAKAVVSQASMKMLTGFSRLGTSLNDCACCAR